MKGGKIRTVLGLAVVLVVIAAIMGGSFAVSGSWAGKAGADEVDTPVDWRPELTPSGGLQRFSSYAELKDFLKTTRSYPGYWYLFVELEDAAATIGPPSLDIRFTPNMIYVGSINGVVYAVEASF